MASALQKLLRKSLPPTTRFINGFNPSQAPNPIVSLHRECHRPTTEPSPVMEPLPFESSSCSTVIFPSFPFGFSSKPILASGFCFPEVEDPGLEDSRTVWADSVKKKRKKKMNKHKYQKLRKRMRRQS
ncbi:uncharacterized protein LOC133316311 [Gastrolobium bilobum]|uniref:uncharacterized protein LOC133316311 n=1 Tax=Gastrolobium bilobum TaxID=150636 RepID=UPI002AB32736|nr:uncharacterized protein LOC133316311 [Gastrolobium bilobum]